MTTSSSLSPDTKKRKTTKSKKSGTGVVASNGNTAQKSKQQQQRQDGTTQSLHNFFQPATDEQRWSFSKSDLGTRQASSFAEQLEDDLIEDDWFDADALLESAVYSSRTLLTNDPKGQKTQKDRLGNGAGRTVIPIQSKGIPRPVSKRFILDADDESVRAPEETGQKPWSEQYPPALMDQLAVHKKKVADVRDWLHAALSGGSRRHVRFCFFARSLLSRTGSADKKTVEFRRKYWYYTVQQDVGKRQPSLCSRMSWISISSTGEIPSAQIPMDANIHLLVLNLTTS